MRTIKSTLFIVNCSCDFKGDKEGILEIQIAVATCMKNKMINIIQASSNMFQPQKRKITKWDY